MKFIKVIKSNKIGYKQLEFNFDGDNNLYQIIKFVIDINTGDIKEDNSLHPVLIRNKEKAIKKAEAIFNQLVGYYCKFKKDSIYHIEVTVYDMNKNKIKEFKNY